MTILDHAGIPEILRQLYMLEVKLARVSREVSEYLDFHGCCGTDRPEDCGDCSCPEQRRWAEMESQAEPTPTA